MIYFYKMYRVPFFWTLQVAFFVHSTTRESGINVTILVNGWCLANSSESNVIYECFHCTFEIFHIYSGSITTMKLVAMHLCYLKMTFPYVYIFERMIFLQPQHKLSATRTHACRFSYFANVNFLEKRGKKSNPVFKIYVKRESSLRCEYKCNTKRRKNCTKYCIVLFLLFIAHNGDV